MKRKVTIIRESKVMSVIELIISLSFAVASIIVRDKISTPVLLVSLVFFGGGGILLLIQLLNPSNRFIKPGSLQEKRYEEEERLRKLQDTGMFLYTHEGFILLNDKTKTLYKWKETDALFACRRHVTDDRAVFDETYLFFFFSNSTELHISEYLPGWPVFIKKSEENICPFPVEWQKQLTASSHDLVRLLVFDKKGRTEEESESAYFLPM